jgi:glycerol kinase
VAFVLALDQGTTSSRALVFSEEGAIAGMGQREYPQIYPQPGWVEHDPLAIWESQLAVAREALTAARISASELSGIGIANQRETALLWERRTGNPVCNAIVWQDRRTADACERLRAAGHAEIIRAKTGLEVDAYFSATKLAWMLDHMPGARERARRGELAFGTVDSWLVWKLTGGQCGGAGLPGGAVHATDVSNASRTMLFDIHRAAWDDELLRLLDVPREVLPEVRPTDGGFGEAASEWLGSRVPIRGVIGDQQAALLGQGCTRPGMVKCTYGTGCFLLMHTGTQAVESRHRLLTTIALQRSNISHWNALNNSGKKSAQLEYALEGSVFSAGAAVQWLRDGLGVLQSASEIEFLARSVRDSGGVTFVPAFTGLGAPYWNPRARGTILGITRGTTKAHLARAALEAIAHQVADVIEAMAADVRVNAARPAGKVATPANAGTTDTATVAHASEESDSLQSDGTRADIAPKLEWERFSLRVDGGAAANDLLLQIQADISGSTVERCCNQEATAAGAATVGGLSLAQSRKECATFNCCMNESTRKAARHRWAQAIHHAG